MGNAVIANASFSEGRFDPEVIFAIERTRMAIMKTELASKYSLQDPDDIVKIVMVLRAVNELEYVVKQTLATAQLGFRNFRSLEP